MADTPSPNDPGRVEVRPDQRAHLAFDRWADRHPDAPAYWFRLPSWVQDYAAECVRQTEARLSPTSAPAGDGASEPTEEMIEAGKGARLKLPDGAPPGVALAAIYRAMHAARPSAPAGDGARRETLAAGAIIDVMTGGKFDWRSRIDDDEFLESGDWATALAYARAASAALSTQATDREKVLEEARLFSEWHEDHGQVLWWRLPISEAPYVGSPLDLGRGMKVVVQIGVEEHDLPMTNTGGWPFDEEDEGRLWWTPLPKPEFTRRALAQASSEAKR